MRLAIPLNEVRDLPDPDVPRRSRKSIRKSFDVKPVFAILNVCLLTPLSERLQHLSIYNDKLESKNILKICVSKKTNPPVNYDTICNETYCEFDKQIDVLINYIIEKEITSSDQEKGFLCCNLKNMSNKLTRLIACDFNKRIPSNTNWEFMVSFALICKM